MLLGACPDPDTTTTQIMGIYIAYARAHPDELGSPAAVVAIKAMHEAFPCK